MVKGCTRMVNIGIGKLLYADVAEYDAEVSGRQGECFEKLSVDDEMEIPVHILCMRQGNTGLIRREKSEVNMEKVDEAVTW